MLELAILGLLKEQPLHGYELKKRLGETLGSLWGISYGSLYPALRRLEHDGSIEIVEPETGRRRRCPATGSLDGDLAAARLRRAGQGDPPHEEGLPDHRAGRRPLLASCSSTTTPRGDDERTFALKLAFCGHLDPDVAPRASSPAGAPRSPSAWRARGARHPAAATATRGRCSSTAPSPPNETSNGSTHSIAAEGRTDARARRSRADQPVPDRRSPRIMSGRIRVAIAGVGNCASSLVQGVEYYRNADPTEDVPGLMHVVLGGYHVGDVDFVAAFDVDADKVGLDLGKAISAGAEQHHQVRQRRPARGRGAARPDVRRPRQVLPRDDRGVAGRAGRRGPGAARHARPTCS